MQASKMAWQFIALLRSQIHSYSNIHT